ncbi:MAG TPA: TetR/AcrR family transcriptional regulator [Solirubrobacteraceae bacterium]|nr:TetR/AcrR family transcriptional regulator [Solirubrobacteraceae bacterium]
MVSRHGVVPGRTVSGGGVMAAGTRVASSARPGAKVRSGATVRTSARVQPRPEGAQLRSGRELRRSVRESQRPARIPSRGGLSEGQIVEIQRSRLLAGAVDAIEEFGYAQTTVAQITSRARVSRRTFYELFENREACLAELIENVLAMIEDELANAGLEDLRWRERVRGGLWAILAFFDRETALARVCVVHSQHGGPGVLARRDEIVARLADVLDQGRSESSRASDCTPLTAEGLVGAAFGIVYARLVRGERRPLTELTCELMGMIVLPYLGPAVARREQVRPAPASAKASATQRRPPGLLSVNCDPLQEVPMRLTYRTARVLECVAAQPGISNRAVADRAGVFDQGQISKLLARLGRLGLVVNSGNGHARGEPNAWTLTALGRKVVQRLGTSTGSEEATT